MAKFLRTSAVTNNLEELIINSKEKLYLVTPFLKISERVKGLIAERDRARVEIRIIYGKTELQPAEAEWIGSLESTSIFFCENLHAKCYISETQAILTSMNLYEASQVNNYEMGIIVLKEEDGELYKDISDETLRILQQSSKVQVTVQRDEGNKVKETKKARPSASEKGHCIRCGKEVKQNIEKPYCLDCFKTWSQFENPEYEEKFCHNCGKPNKSTMLKPVCYPCYKSSK
ncbi:phospholipase D family protein [bacterium]|nr:phospholipase D family protein [bacterium]